PARACSCVPPDPWSFLKQADGAFVGRLVSRREAGDGRAVLTFRVEREVKGKIGDTVEVTTANNGAACGIETSVGHRIGLFLAREGGGWVGHLCWQVAPEDLLAAGSLPAPNGRGDVALYVGGRFGPARTLALDSKGRTLAYGYGRGTTDLLSPCPGRQRLAEIGRGELTIRDVRSLRVIRSRPLQLPGKRIPVALQCEDSTGSSVVIFAVWPRGDAPFRSAIYRITSSRIEAVWNGTARLSSLNPGIAYLNAGDATDRLVSVDFRTGRVMRLARLPLSPSVVPDATGRRLAGVAYRLLERSRVVLIDLASKPPTIRTAPLAAPEVLGEVHWLPGERLAFLPFDRRDTARVLDLQLNTRSRFRWTGGQAALLNSTVFGTSWKPRALVSANLPSGPQRVVRGLPGKPFVIVSASG
ncbi:MAG TPA: hypothetical protein VFR38_04675, partial [Gaiellaceae bacterium]|nr:hypothetical protein [Gaiellaceae bacterium]